MNYPRIAALGTLAVLALSAAASSAGAAAIQHYWDFEGDAPFADKAGLADGSVTANTTVTLEAGHNGGTAMRTQSLIGGDDDLVRIDSSQTFVPGSTPFAMSYWFNIADDGATTPRGLFDFGGNGGDGPQSLHIGTTNNLAFRVDGLDGGGAALNDNAGAGYEDGQWHFVAANYDPVAGIEVHIDGYGVDASNAGAFGEVTFDLDQYLGSFNFTGSAENKGLDGLLDDVAFYSGTLSQSQIEGLFDGTLQPTDIPEPAAALLLLSGAVAGLSLQRSRRSN